jgi:hypothetical protein
MAWSVELWSWRHSLTLHRIPNFELDDLFHSLDFVDNARAAKTLASAHANGMHLNSRKFAIFITSPGGKTSVHGGRHNRKALADLFLHRATHILRNL